jgi:hypothetical protein
VKFGISPFGIWKQGFPAQIKGLDAYDVLYADARKWLREGWIDYLTPQLYWAEEKRETSFRALLDWWNSENVHHRHVWPGLDASRVGDLRTPEVIVTQVRQSRAQPGADGNILWGARALAENRRGLTELLARQVYDKPAVPPAYPWLGARPVEKPFVSAKADGAGGTRVTCRPTGAEPIRWWILQARLAGAWTMELRAASQSDQVFVLPGRPEVIAAATVDRAGKMSEFVELERQGEKAGTPP